MQNPNPLLSDATLIRRNFAPSRGALAQAGLECSTYPCPYTRQFIIGPPDKIQAVNALFAAQRANLKSAFGAPYFQAA
jgi:hypothetical protein